jgi:hypothetical protein
MLDAGAGDGVRASSRAAEPRDKANGPSEASPEGDDGATSSALTERGSRVDAEGAVAADAPGSGRAAAPETETAIDSSRSVSASELVEQVAPGESKTGGIVAKVKARTKICPHRLAPGTYCWRCDA